jgi:lysophospholipase L1-like esterase
MKTVERVILAGMCVAFLSFVVVHDGGISVAQDGSANAGKNLQLTKQQDLRAQPVKCVVALGESTTWGYSATSKEKCWVNRTVRLLEEFQGRPIKLINQGIGSNVLTPKCPAYPRSAKPSASERLDRHVIALKPDLVLLSYGLNDSRGGTDPEVFRTEYQLLIDRIRAKINPVIVILNVYYMHEQMYQYRGWHHSDYEVTEVFNRIIEELARKNGVILADVYAAEKGVDWIIDGDHCHPNNLGHSLIAHRVFEAIARNCSFVTGALPKQSSIQSFRGSSQAEQYSVLPLEIRQRPRSPMIRRANQGCDSQIV